MPTNPPPEPEPMGMQGSTVSRAVFEFLNEEALGGMALVLAAAVALLAANSPWSQGYADLVGMDVAVRIGDAELAKPLLLWVNDGLMAIFFFLVGLEIKRELLDGELADWRRAVLPGFAALGGMLLPAAIYTGINWSDAVAIRGWAIPAATDIAFALGVLALLGSRVPASLKLFLLTIAILDDLGAIVIIAFFYTESLTGSSLALAAVACAVLAVLNRFGVVARAPYVLVGLALWLAVLESGVHATLAGVVLAAFVPLRSRARERSLLRDLEHDLHPWVAFLVLPLFAFANAGISLAGLEWSALLEPVPLGVAAGLFLGKQAGVFGFGWIALRLGLAHRLPEVGLLELYGVAVLCGIGFTMSLFIGSLAFEHGGLEYALDVRLGIIVGSLLSAATGYGVLHMALARRARMRDAFAESP